MRMSIQYNWFFNNSPTSSQHYCVPETYYCLNGIKLSSNLELLRSHPRNITRINSLVKNYVRVSPIPRKILSILSLYRLSLSSGHADQIVHRSKRMYFLVQTISIFFLIYDLRFIFFTVFHPFAGYKNHKIFLDFSLKKGEIILI